MTVFNLNVNLIFSVPTSYGDINNIQQISPQDQTGRPSSSQQLSLLVALHSLAAHVLLDPRRIVSRQQQGARLLAASQQQRISQPGTGAGARLHTQQNINNKVSHTSYSVSNLTLIVAGVESVAPGPS